MKKVDRLVDLDSDSDSIIILESADEPKDDNEVKNVF